MGNGSCQLRNIEHQQCIIQIILVVILVDENKTYGMGPSMAMACQCGFAGRLPINLSGQLNCYCQAQPQPQFNWAEFALVLISPAARPPARPHL